MTTRKSCINCEYWQVKTADLSVGSCKYMGTTCGFETPVSCTHFKDVIPDSTELRKMFDLPLKISKESLEKLEAKEMYESPIQLYQTDNFMDNIIKQFEEEREAQIIATVNTYVQVDKDELIKALNYDRGQYQKGYEDAKRQYERPHGEWIVEKSAFGDRLNCSLCGARPMRSAYGYDLHDNFCHECGADMRIKGEDDE